jgi:hypothetical protein
MTHRIKEISMTTSPAHATSNDRVLETASFRLMPGTDVATFLEAAAKTEASLRARGSIVRRLLSRNASGGWSDVIEWTSMDDALAAAEAVMQDPAFALFGTMIDPDTVQMRHAPILWRME